jgi:hypothetical protein
MCMCHVIVYVLTARGATVHNKPDEYLVFLRNAWAQHIAWSPAKFGSESTCVTNQRIPNTCSSDRTRHTQKSWSIIMHSRTWHKHRVKMRGKVPFCVPAVITSSQAMFAWQEISLKGAEKCYLEAWLWVYRPSAMYGAMPNAGNAFVCMYVCMYVCMCMCICVHVCMLNVCMYVCMYVFWMYACVGACMYISVGVFVFVSVRIHMYVPVHLHMHMQCTYTYRCIDILWKIYA